MSGHACIQAALLAALVMSMLMASALAAPQNDLSSEFGSQPICGCGRRSAKRGRVVGGDELQLNSAPWLATLARGRKSHCGAALISGVHILTAAHCIDGAPLSDLKTWLGVHSLAAAGLVMSARSLFRGNLLEDQDDEGEGVGRSIKMAWAHPQFDSSTFRNDIAVLELTYPVKFSSRLYPICLPSNDREQYDQRIALVAGWGRTGEQLPPSDVPRQAMIEVWSNDQCQNSGLPRARLRGAILCAGRISGGLDACQGDSGGPLVLSGSNGEMEVIGVVSWGRGCARPNLPGVYTRVASFLPFIRNAMSNSCPT